MLEHGVRSADFVNLPPGPNSPVGVLWMGLNKSGIGLHGTNTPRDHRPGGQPRLHPAGELGRRQAQPDAHGGRDRPHRRRRQAARAGARRADTDALYLRRRSSAHSRRDDGKVFCKTSLSRTAFLLARTTNADTRTKHTPGPILHREPDQFPQNTLGCKLKMLPVKHRPALAGAGVRLSPVQNQPTNQPTQSSYARRNQRTVRRQKG